MNYIVQIKRNDNIGWFDYWRVDSLKTARKMCEELKKKYNEKYRVVKEM